VKPRGRPRIAEDDSTVNVSFRLPAKQYDRTEQEAKRADLPLSEWLRRVVERASRPKAKV
jgi:hypothetical protein